MAVLENLSPAVFSLIALAIFAIAVFVLRKRKLKFWQSALLIISPVMVLVLFAVVRYRVLESELHPFESHLHEYLSAKEVQQGGTYLRGKIIPVNVRDKTIDYSFYYELPEELRAANPEEVETALWLDCRGQQMGTYSGGGGAYRWICEINVIDLWSAKIIGEESFAGSDPPMTKLGSGNEYGSFPSDQIVDYLAALPRK